MSFRSVLIGMVLAVGMCASCYFSDYVVRPGAMINHLLPAVAYGGLVALVLAVNPLLRLFHAKWSLRGCEVAVILGIFLISCGVPEFSLAKSVTYVPIWPLHINRIQPSWKNAGVIKLVPEVMFCDISGKDGEDVLNGFVTGMEQGNHRVPISKLPWRAWRRPILFWGPLVLSFLIGIYGLAAVFHHQWSSNEQLTYPIVQFASSLMPDEKGGLAPIFRNKMFWSGFLVVLLIFLNNYGVRWFPKFFIPVRLRLDFQPFIKLFPTIIKGRGLAMFSPEIVFTVIGLAYLLPSDASLTMWLGPWLFCLIFGIAANYGVQMRSSQMMAMSPEAAIYNGSYAAVLLIVLYSGRQFYWNTLKRAFCFKSRENIPDYSVSGMRVFLASMAFFLIYLSVRTPVHWTLGLIWLAMAVMTYAVVSRVLAETGAFQVGTMIYPGVAVWGLFGEAALGPTAILSLSMLTVALLTGPGWCVMPFINHAFKLCDMRKVAPGRFAGWGLLTLVLAIVVACGCTLYWQYDLGAASTWGRYSSHFPFNNGVDIMLKLRALGLEQEALGRQGLDYLSHMSMNLPFIGVSVLSFFICLLIAFGRLKFAWWPSHPVICIFFGGDQSMWMSFSFGIGYVLKTLITHFGGARLYQECKPLFIGMIAGMVGGQFVPMVIGAAYYFITGETVH